MGRLQKLGGRRRGVVPCAATGASMEAACPDWKAHRTAHGTRCCRWRRPHASRRSSTPVRTPNTATERRSSPPWSQRTTARRACSRIASELGVVSLGPRREPAGTALPSCKPRNHARQTLYRVEVFQQAARDSEPLDVWDVSCDSELQQREPSESAMSPPPDSDPSLNRSMGFAAKPEQSRPL